MYGLGRRQATDIRDRKYMAIDRHPIMQAPRKLYDRVFYRTGPPLDQGDTPQCVAYSTTLQMLAFPIYAKPGKVVPQAVYDLAQQVDEFDDTPPGDGTSVRAGMKALLQMGHLKYYVWFDNAAQIQIWMQAGAGTVTVGTDWLSSMWEPDATARIRVDYNSGIVGGHAWTLCGFDPAHDFGQGPLEAFRMQNSWGSGWGQAGRAWILKTDLDLLLANVGEAGAGVEVLSDAA